MTLLPRSVAATGMRVFAASSSSAGWQPEAVDFGVGEDHGPLRAVDHPDGFGDALRERVGVGHLIERRQARAVRTRLVDAVARKLDEARPLVALDGVQDAVNLLVRRRRVVERGDGDGDVAEDVALGGEVADAVMEQRVARALGHAGRSGDDEDGRFLRPRAGDGIGEVESADAVGHARHAEPAEPRVSIGRKPRAVLARHADELDGALLHERVEFEDIVPRHPEHVPRAAAVALLNQVLPDRERSAHPALLISVCESRRFSAAAILRGDGRQGNLYPAASISSEKSLAKTLIVPPGGHR